MNILIVDKDKVELGALKAMLASKYELAAFRDAREGIQSILESAPDVIIAKLGKRGGAAIPILEFLRDSRRRIPTIVLVPSEAEKRKSDAVKLLAEFFLTSPASGVEVMRTVECALAANAKRGQAPPEMTSAEEIANLTKCCEELNNRVKCGLAKNQVYVQSILTGYKSRTKPRIALKCKIRPMFGFPQDVYFEHIKKICSGDPEVLCEPFKMYKEKGAR